MGPTCVPISDHFLIDILISRAHYFTCLFFKTEFGLEDCIISVYSFYIISKMVLFLFLVAE